MTTRGSLADPTRGSDHPLTTSASTLDERFALTTARVLAADAMAPPPDHWDVLFAAIHLVRTRGVDEATAALTAALSRSGHPATGTARRGHATLTAFTVWAVDRLLAAGLDTIGVLWHPLCRPDAALTWYERATLATDAAHDGFVVADRALPTDPQPAAPAIGSATRGGAS